MKRFLHRVAPLLIVLVMAGASWLLYHQLKNYKWADISQAWSEIPASRIWMALGFTILSYVVLVGYDFLAVRSIGHPLPLRKIALGSFIGFSISYTFGALLGGTSVRYRMYSSWGLTTIEIVRLIVTVGTTFWLGVFALGGVLFVLNPFEIPASLGSLKLPFKTVQPLGYFLLGLTTIYFLMAALWRTPFKVQNQEVKLPGLRMSIAQVTVAAVDFAVAAACLYVLLPDDLPLNFVQFLAVYMLAWVAVVFTHVPGGLGVFDLVIVTLTHESRKDAVIVALAAFRVMYYLIPAFIAMPLFLLHEASIRGSAVNRIVARLFGENAVSGAMPIPTESERSEGQAPK